jgi:hypothetical protein
MRWDRLFEDLEAQLALDESRELGAEIADRTRRERALLDAQARLLANLGAGGIALRLPAGVVVGRLVDVGPDWVLLEPRPDRPVLVPLSAVRAVTGLEAGARRAGVVARRFVLGAALRAVSRDRATVELVDVDGRTVTGTIDVVGSDHLELSEHPADEPRRRENVVERHLVPFWALAAVRRL